MTRVSVWGHKPTADELLQRRLAQGWQPTPTELVDGDRVLGFAETRGAVAPASED